MNNGRFNSGSIRLPFNGACVLGVVRPGGGIRPDISTILFYFDTSSCLIRVSRARQQGTLPKT